LSIARFFNYLYYWLMTHVDPKKVEQLERQLNEPLAGGRVSDSEKQRDAESFTAFAGVMGIKPPKGS